jgi:hypothetical protein
MMWSYFSGAGHASALLNRPGDNLGLTSDSVGPSGKLFPSSVADTDRWTARSQPRGWPFHSEAGEDRIFRWPLIATP